MTENNLTSSLEQPKGSMGNDSLEERVNALVQKSPEELTAYVDSIFSKLQRNLEHNSQIFQEKAQDLVNKVGEIEAGLQDMLARLQKGPSIPEGLYGADVMGREDKELNSSDGHNHECTREPGNGPGLSVRSNSSIKLHDEPNSSLQQSPMTTLPSNTHTLVLSEEETIATPSRLPVMPSSASETQPSCTN